MGLLASLVLSTLPKPTEALVKPVPLTAPFKATGFEHVMVLLVALKLAPGSDAIDEAEA